MLTHTLNDVVDSLGNGWSQVRLVVLAGSVYAVGGEMLFMFSIMPVPIATELGFSVSQRAALGSCTYLGQFLGNLAGMSNDSLGRRRPILISLSGMCFFCGLSACCYNFWLILLCWMCAGFFFGFGITSWVALCTETSPKESRLTNFAISLCWGMLWSSTAALFLHFYLGGHGHDALVKEWRNVILYFRIPNLLWIALYFFPGYVESPHFLVNRGRRHEADEELKKMRKQNNCGHVSIEFEQMTAPVQLGWYKGFATIFGPELQSTTIVFAALMWLMMFASDGSTYAASMVLHFRADVLWEHAALTPSLALFTVALTGVFGYFVAVMLERWVGRKSLISFFLVGATGSCGFYVLGSLVFQILEGISYSVPDGQRLGMWLMLAAVCMIRLFASIGSVALFVSSSEAFPTSVRATAGGFCQGFGRTGSLAAPFVFEYLLSLTGRRKWYFVVTAMLCMSFLPVAMLRLRETKGKPLQESVSVCSSKCEDHLEEASPLKRGMLKLGRGSSSSSSTDPFIGSSSPTCDSYGSA